MIGLVIFVIVATAMIFSVMTFSKSGVIGRRNANTNALRKFIQDQIVQQSQGSTWFGMTQNSTGLKHPDFPGLSYDINVGEISSGVRNCTITIHSLDPND